MLYFSGTPVFGCRSTWFKAKQISPRMKIDRVVLGNW